MIRNQVSIKRGQQEVKPYDFEALEKKWRPYWQEIGLYHTGADPGKPKYYILDFFPYPSGEGLSVGHCRNYVPTCVAARYMRQKGYNVLHPMGWDAFGLPAENYAIQYNVHPKITTPRQAANYRRQMQLVECSYDWSREINSTDPEYYRWTQWFFLLLFKRGLAYQALGSQWWCPKDKTILANEQVENGRCWRCGSLVTRKDLKQWYFKITDYAERLLADLDVIDWPESIKTMQRNWIGRSEGAEVIFTVVKRFSKIVLSEYEIPTFTTRLDTLFGVTFLVLAPEHPLTLTLTTDEQRAAVTKYVEQAQRKTEIDRLSTGKKKEKTGIFTGAYANHPISGDKIPIWVADYVLMGYGTGAVMGVPGHDSRDYAFARKYDLPIIEVVQPVTPVDPAERAVVKRFSKPVLSEVEGSLNERGFERCFTGYGVMVNSGSYSGLTSDEGIARLAAELETKGLGRRQVTYKMRDWLISRQRYWGAPIPIVHCHTCGPVVVPEDQLPVLLPDLDDFAPGEDGRSPLAKVKSWVNTTCPQCGEPARRETDTMDGFACSSWYFLRFANRHYQAGPFDPEAVRYWLPVDTYVGGAEHAVLHLLYARFWTKVMYDAGLIHFVEPFSSLRNQGVLHAPDGRRMSKSRGNVITPDEVIAEHGTDALRTYILFIGPFDADVLWDDTGIKGVNRFLERYWKLATSIRSRSVPSSAVGEVARLRSRSVPSSAVGEVAFAQRAIFGSGQGEVEKAFRRQMHRTIQKVTQDFEQFKFNTAVAALMEYLNFLYDYESEAVSPELWREGLATLTRLLCPIAPFITEEIWQEVLGHQGESVHETPWPEYDEGLIAADTVTIVVQVNGRVRDKVEVDVNVDDGRLREIVLARPKVQEYVNGKPIRNIIIVPQKLVNIVV